MGYTPAHEAGPSLHWVSVTDPTGRTRLQMRWATSALEADVPLPVDPTEVAVPRVPRVTPAA